jgi:hypothetical protein
MARGFESKSVADQQDSALNPPIRPLSDPPDPVVVKKRRGLELARADVVHQLTTARSEVHRDMLRQALQAIDRELEATP